MPWNPIFIFPHMNNATKARFLAAAIGFTILSLKIAAQTPNDAQMMSKGEICVAAVYSHDAWDEYWEGTLKRDNGNIGTLTRQTVMPMFALGIHKRINVIAALPWVSTSASAGQVTGVSGIQDWGLWIKGEALNRDLGPGALTIHAVAGINGPASNYLPDYMPFSLGLGCYDGSLRGIVQYKMGKGPFIRANASYHVRSTCTIERDYYYTTQAVYSNKVDMPNAVMYGTTLGSWLFKNSLKIEASFDGLKTLGGHDIRRQDVGFPSNKMIFTRVGAGLQYYLPFVKGLGVLASGSQILTGRNVGQSTAFTGGITYQFNVWK